MNADVRDNLRVTGSRATIRTFTRADAGVQVHWPQAKCPLAESYALRVPDYGLDDYFAGLKVRTDYARFAVEVDGEFCAAVSLRDMRAGGRAARLGLVVNPDCVGRGVGRAAMELFLPLHFTVLGFDRLDLDVAVVNRRAVRLYDALGFRRTGRRWQELDVEPDELPRVTEHDLFPHTFRLRNGVVFAVHFDMSMTRREYRARQAAVARSEAGVS